MTGRLRSLFRYGVLALCGTVLLLAAFAAHEWYARPPLFIGNFFNRLFVQYLWDRPEDLTYLGILEQFGISGHNARWNDDSEAAAREEFEFVREQLAVLALYDAEELSEVELLSSKVLREFIGDPEADWRFRHHDYPVNQLDGLQISIPAFLDTYQPVESSEDAEHYISRLAGIGRKMEQNMEGLLIREQKGIIPPTFVIDKSIAGMEEFVAPPAAENLLVKSLARKLESADDVGEDDRQAFLAAAATQVQEVVYPAYRQYIDYFTGLRGRSGNVAGVWRLPEGNQYYNYLLRRHTTTELTADEIHATGVAAVARVQQAMLEIFAAEGYDPALGVQGLFDELASDERFFYPDTDAGREQILQDYASIIEEIEQGMDSAFAKTPEAGIVVERMPAFTEKSTAGAYYSPPSRDGSRPGIFYVSLADLKATPRYSMRTLAYHEGVPGHHFQLATQVELQDIPEFRTAVSFTAYIEGWALYAERLAWEMGFQDDPYDNLGRLQAELLRAVRLVVDTGIHAKRWTREQAIDYMLTNTGWPRSDVIAEIERYIVSPGQATAYMVGMLEILRLRSEAQGALGEAFDIREFHDVMLQNGALPLTALRELVMQYIAREQAGG